MTPRTRAVAALLVAALLFSAMSLCAKRATATLPAAEVAFLRFVFGLLTALAAHLLGRPLRPRNLAGLGLRGLFGGGAVLLYFVALAHLPAGVATLLNYSSPIFTIVFSALFLREPMTLRSIIAIVIAGAGVYLTARGNHGGDTPLAAAALPYLLAGVVSSVFSGAAVTTIRGMRKSEGSLEIFTAFCLVGALVTGVPTAFSFVRPSLALVPDLLAVGASSVVAQLLMTYALRDVTGAVGGLLLMVTPVSTLGGGALFLGERPGPVGLVGAALVLAGVSLGLLRPAPPILVDSQAKPPN